jgi:hypothetical protein
LAFLILCFANAFRAYVEFLKSAGFPHKRKQHHFAEADAGGLRFSSRPSRAALPPLLLAVVALPG